MYKKTCYWGGGGWEGGAGGTGGICTPGIDPAIWKIPIFWVWQVSTIFDNKLQNCIYC